MENNKDTGNVGYILAAGMIFFGILLYLLFSHGYSNFLAMFFYIIGLLTLVSEFGSKDNKRGIAYLVAGFGFLLLTLTFVNQDHVFYQVIFAVFLTITFLIFLGGAIEGRQSKSKKRANLPVGKKQNKEFNKVYSVVSEVLNLAGSILSIILFIYEFFL